MAIPLRISKSLRMELVICYGIKLWEGIIVRGSTIIFKRIWIIKN